MQCDLCERSVVFVAKERSLMRITVTKRALCASCLLSDIEQRVFDAMTYHEMFLAGDRVLLCVSGEKDSTVMMHLVDKYIKTRQLDVDVLVLAVDEGISDYRSRCVDVVRRHAEARALRFVMKEYQQVFGITLDTINTTRDSSAFRMCRYCCNFRGEVVKGVAEEFGATKVATGMNLNDTVEHALMCLLMGKFDEQGLPCYTPTSSNVSFVSPIFMLKGIECALYARLIGLEIMNEDCTYCAEHLRDDVAHSLNLLEDKNPGILETFYAGYEQLVSNSTEQLLAGAHR